MYYGGQKSPAINSDKSLDETMSGIPEISGSWQGRNGG